MVSLPENQFHICHVVASMNENTGGTANAIGNLAGSMSNGKIEPHIFTLNYANCGHQILPQNVKIHSYPATIISRHLRGFQPHAGRKLKQLAKDFNLLHNHGLWMFPNLYAREASTQNNIPLITSPRGMLEAWSLKRSRFKKRLAWWFYEYQNLSHATAFHATSEDEAISIRRAGFKQPIAVIPDGVCLPEIIEKPSKNIIIEEFPELQNKYWLLFLSRLHPKKGLETLFHVWNMISSQFPDWHLIIAGPDWQGYRVKLESFIEKQSLKERVTFTGMLTGHKKDAILFHSDLFVLPTFSENFGIAIAESLAHGVPVITTKGAPWQDLDTYQCGWWLENKPEILAKTLKEGMKLSATERQIMGNRGRQLVASKYAWKAISDNMISFYGWILNGGTPPDFIILR